MDLSTSTPAAIDQAWIDALAPAHRLYAQANEQAATAGKYRRAGGHYVEQADRYDARAADLRARASKIRDEFEPPFTAEWEARGGWTRAYIVPDGHIHRTTACSSLHPTTIVSWLPELSGSTEDEIVAYAGSVACTICYPSAPVEALRAAEAAAKAATECPGSRTFGIVAGTFRQTSYTGSGAARCATCHERVSITTSGKIKAHARKAAA